MIRTSVQLKAKVGNLSGGDNNKALKKHCKYEDGFAIANNFYDFYAEFFDIDLLQPHGEILVISESDWKKLYTKGMDKARSYFKEHQTELLDSLNSSLFQEMWDKYRRDNFFVGDISWENVNESVLELRNVLQV